MLKIYCQDCGSPTSYTSLKPKFCSSCGKPFDKNIVVNPVQMQKPIFTKSQNIKRQIQSNLDEDYDDVEDYSDEVNYVPNINKIDIEITEVKPNKIKMKDIMPNIPEEVFSKEDNIKPIKGKKNQNKSKKIIQKESEVLKQFKSEAGTLRPSYRRNRKEIDG